MNLEPVAWMYELADGYDKGAAAYTHWNKHISFRRPSVPSKSIKNLQPLYTEDQVHAVASKSSV